MLRLALINFSIQYNYASGMPVESTAFAVFGSGKAWLELSDLGSHLLVLLQQLTFTVHFSHC